MLGIMTGIGDVVIKLILLFVAGAIAVWIGQSIMKKSWVALITSVAASALVVWALWGGGLGDLAAVTETETKAMTSTSVATPDYVDMSDHD